MKQQFFEQLGEARWSELRSILDALDHGRTADTKDFPRLYRRVCQDLALARDRRFGARLVDLLNELTLRGHRHLYEARVRRANGIRRFVVGEFPRAVRAEWKLVLLASLLFYGSGVVTGWLVYDNPDLVYSFISADQIEEIESMYRPGNHPIGDRGSDDDVAMFGFYIWNNVSIAFRTFASGLFFGVGTLFVLISNGLFLGIVATHLAQVGSSSTFFPFVIGHGAFELTAIVLAGVAGLRLGLSLLAPGPFSRLQSLRRAARRSLLIVYGVGGMLFIAALIEAFWSPNTVFPPTVKYTVGVVFWLLVGSYFVFPGRGYAD
ncbi:MAG: stage II sporulation protein M [bacterium]|nr:stage II sporulation protein M [bacterium]